MSSPPVTAPPDTGPSTTLGFRRKLTPTWLHAACVLAGHRPPDLGRAFRYVHLTRGLSTTPAVVAANHPGSAVWAWSDRPAGIEAAVRLRNEGGLENLHVHEHPGFPRDLGGDLADVVVIEEVLTAVTDERRAEIIEAVAGAVRPGALVCVTYRTTVGWSEIVPVVRVMQRVARRHTGDPDHLVPGILALLDQLRAGSAQHLTLRPAVATWLEHLLATDPDTITAEYLEDNLRPLSHPEVAAALAEAGCRYVGSARLADELDLDVPRGLEELVETAATPLLREAYRDLAVRPLTRVDLFRVGPAPLGEVAQRAALAEVGLVTLDPDDGTGAAAMRDTASDDLATQVAAIRHVMDAGIAHPTVIGGLDPDAVDACARLDAALERTGGPWSDLVAVAPLGTALSRSGSIDPSTLADLIGSP